MCGGHDLVHGGDDLALGVEGQDGGGQQLGGGDHQPDEEDLGREPKDSRLELVPLGHLGPRVGVGDFAVLQAYPSRADLARVSAAVLEGFHWVWSLLADLSDQGAAL